MAPTQQNTDDETHHIWLNFAASSRSHANKYKLYDSMLCALSAAFCVLCMSMYVARAHLNWCAKIRARIELHGNGLTRSEYRIHKHRCSATFHTKRLAGADRRQNTCLCSVRGRVLCVRFFLLLLWVCHLPCIVYELCVTWKNVLCVHIRRTSTQQMTQAIIAKRVAFAANDNCTTTACRVV